MTYVDHDLDVRVDLGVWWNEKTGGLPMPLGGNVVRRDLGKQVMEDVTKYTKMAQTFDCEPGCCSTVRKKWGRGIDDDTNRELVTMYVNERTIDYKKDGRDSIRMFLREGQEIGLIESDFDVGSVQFIGKDELIP